MFFLKFFFHSLVLLFLPLLKKVLISRSHKNTIPFITPLQFFLILSFLSCIHFSVIFLNKVKMFWPAFTLSLSSRHSISSTDLLMSFRSSAHSFRVLTMLDMDFLCRRAREDRCGSAILAVAVATVSAMEWPCSIAAKA